MNITLHTRSSHNKWYKRWANLGLGEAANLSKFEAVFLAFVEG